MNYFILDHLSFIVDPLSLFFLAVIFVVSIPAFIYSPGYLKGHVSGGKTVLLHALTAVFIASMAAVVTSADVIAFLIAWEIMSLVSFFLVVFDHEQSASVSAGVMYIIMTHIGTAFLIAAFTIMYVHGHSFKFGELTAACASMPQNLRDLVFVFLFIGFGTKAGVVPLHIWLPYAHPQAPSHISSIMSGVMIKTAVYGMIRFIVFMLGPASSWWAVVILVFASVSCLAGIIYALMEHDIKKLLAYSSVENMGIILLGLGASMLFYSMGMSAMAVFALSAALYHIINHAVFKGLLFMGAGAVYNAAGTRNMEKMGGLVKNMPVTAVLFLCGAMAISALPPFNGFVSEWLMLQSFFGGAYQIQAGGYKLFLGLCAAVLALTGGLAAACFVKAFGIVFLAKPRSRQAEQAREAHYSMLIAMGILAALALFLGAGASVVIKYIIPIAGYSFGADTAGITSGMAGWSLNLSAGRPGFASPALIGLMLIALSAVVSAVYFFAGKTGKRSYRTWDCGYYNLTSRNEYTATAFSKPFRVAFGFFLFPYRRTQKIREAFYHLTSFKYETLTTPVFKKYFYDPLLRVFLGTAGAMRRIQPGSIHLYIGYIFFTVILLILFMRAF